MKVPFFDLREQYAAIRPEVEAALGRVFESQQFVLGPEVVEFEHDLATYLNVAHTVGMSSGTDALLAALMALEIAPGDEVITTAYSFFATAGVVSRLRATPVFVDINDQTLNLEPSEVLQRIGPRTRVIIPVHLFGRCADVRPLREVARARGIALVEDAAQAIGAFDAHGTRAGSLGNISCFSFFPTKNLGGCGDGGLAATNDASLAESLRMLRVHGSTRKYWHEYVGGNFRLDAVQAAVLRVKLRYLPAWTAARRRNAARYHELFDDAGIAEQVVLPADEPGHVYHQFVIRVRDRERIRAHLSARGIGTEVYYPVPLHLQPCFQTLGYTNGTCPNAEATAREALALPIYPELTQEQQAYVVSAIAQALGSARRHPRASGPVTGDAAQAGRSRVN